MRMLGLELELDFGDRAPPLMGALVTGGFFSIDGQAGRVLVALGGGSASAETQLLWLKAHLARQQDFAALGADIVLLATMDSQAFPDLLAAAHPGCVILSPDCGLSSFGGTEAAPATVVIDRNGRVAGVLRDGSVEARVATALEIVAGLARKLPGHAAAPVLIVPRLLSPSLCTDLIAAFESGPNFEGGMASVDTTGAPILKVQEAKKRRRDFLLEADHPLYAPVLHALGARLAPEIKRAFQIEIAHADRILIACYDDTGGYFHRHRDNSAPQVAFRQFAASLNLNTGSYEGGELEFPEYGDELYIPPLGAAVVFSASLLHAARPVTKGKRYVLLTFLHDQFAEQQRLNFEQSSLVNA